LVDAASGTVSDRRELSRVGFVLVAIALTKAGELVAQPSFEFTGIPATTFEGLPIDDLVQSAIDNIFQEVGMDWKGIGALERLIRERVSDVIFSVWSKTPRCHVQVIVL
jgi:mRNA degradation ribonuclease J1/J2